MSKNIMQMCADEIAGYLKRIADLEAKLAESEEEIKIVREQNGRVIEKLDLIVRSNQDLEKQLAEKDKLINEYADDLAKLQCKIADLAVKEIKAEDKLKQQLEEKEKRIRKLNLEAQKYYEDAYCNDFQDKAKADFAIGQLERVKESVLDVSNGYWRYFMKNGQEYMLPSDLQSCLEEYIDNQINELKGERK